MCQQKLLQSSITSVNRNTLGGGWVDGAVMKCTASEHRSLSFTTTWGFHPCWVVCFHAICRDTVHNRIVFNIFFFCQEEEEGRVVAVVSLSILQDVSIHRPLPPPFSTVGIIDEWLIFAIESINQSPLGDY